MLLASSFQNHCAYLKTDPNFNDKRVDWTQKNQLLLEGCNYDGETPLILAAAAGDLEALKMLLKNGANHKHRNQYGHTALVAAAGSGAVSIVKELTKPELTGGMDRQLQLAFAWAAWEGHHEVVEYLMDKITVGDVMTLERDTPLILAAYAGRDRIVELLLKNCASLHHTNAFGHSALTLAAAAGHKACVKFLLNFCPQQDFEKLSSEELTLAWKAAQKYPDVQSQIHDFAVESKYTLNQLQSNKNERDEKLMRAASGGNSKLVATLIADGANSECLDLNDNTALMLAADGGHSLALVNLLVANANNIHRTNASGDNALILAAKRGHQEAVLHLLEYGANIDHANNDNENAEQCALVAGHIQLAEQLAKARAFLAATGAGREEEVKSMLGHGPFNHVDRYGNTALILAAAAGHLKIVKLLVENFGSAIAHANSTGDTALMCAIQRKHVDVIKYLLGKAHSESLVGDQSDTALHLAASKGEHALIQSLCNSNPADLSAWNSKGYTALCCAAYEGHAHVVSSLSEFYTDILSRDSALRKALQIAIDRKHVATVEILLELGADPRSVSFLESRMRAPRHASRAEMSVAPEAYEYAVISDLLRFSGSLLGKVPVNIGISLTPTELFDRLMNFKVAGQGDLALSWQAWLRAKGVCSFIIVELESLTVNMEEVWKMFTDPDYGSANIEQKKICWAGILTGLAEVKLDESWMTQLIAQGIGRQTLERYRAMLARQQLWLANAGRCVESEMLVRLQGLRATCMTFRTESNRVKTIALYRELQQIGLVYWLAEIISDTFAEQVGQNGADLNSRQFASALLIRINEREVLKRFDRSEYDEKKGITVLALTARQIMLLKYACEKLMSE